MSFYTKYKELYLSDEDFIGEYNFNNSLSDSGPNGNDFSNIYSGPDIFSYSPGSLYLTDDDLRLSIPSEESFSVFLDIKKEPNVSSSLILNTSYSDAGFSFGWGPNGNFFIVCLDESENKIIKFFKKTNRAPRVCLCLSKAGNVFFLHIFDPSSKSLISDTVFFDDSIDFGSDPLRISKNSYSFNSTPFIVDDCRLIVNKMVVVAGGLPGFCIQSLCEELISGADISEFSGSWNVVEDKTNNFFYEDFFRSHSGITSVSLPYSVSKSGFSALRNNIGVETRIFQNGQPSSYSYEGGVIFLDPFSRQDEILGDFFSPDNYLVYSGSFVGSFSSFSCPYGSCIYDEENNRLKKDNFFSIGLNSISSGINYSPLGYSGLDFIQKNDFSVLLDGILLTFNGEPILFSF